MRTLRFLYIVLAITGILASGAVAQVGQGGGMRAERRNMPKPKVVTHNGRPSLEFDGAQGWAFYISFGMHQGEPALAFPVAEGDCQGELFVTRTRVSGDFRNTKCESFDVARTQTTAQRQLGVVTLSSGASKYEVAPEGERNGERHEIRGMTNGSEFVVRAVNNFDIVFRTLHRMAVEAREQSTPQPASATKSTPGATKQAQATLAITSDPGDVHIYVNDQSHGLTSEDGHAMLQLSPGAYKVKLVLPGYNDWQQPVTLAAGASTQVTAKLEPTGPPPFTESDVNEMLEGKMSSKRIATLVEERGVDFALSPDLEKHLRAIGGTSDLLLAIAEHKKK